jgi:hypothetical protein
LLAREYPKLERIGRCEAKIDRTKARTAEKREKHKKAETSEEMQRSWKEGTHIVETQM